MIQRSQTAYLLAAVATCLVMLFSGKPYAKIDSSALNVSIDYMGTMINSTDSLSYPLRFPNLLLIFHTGIIALTALLSVAFFKNRNLQLKLTGINFILILALFGSMYYQITARM